ncbi:TPA: restriction endonuclease subunit S [Escherichia coli]|uniref:restriction endonuclease subunit S n=1 Tax=Escherichia coli TaxID=562 RepID=UPI0024B67902|nr:restriction endonuclease subunit S [Escherichia coli]WHQ35512.1 restriction endonuclease subunit S [Escherichia coli]HDY6635166.1 restriction endonuclease subunit S [Escherichia coli]
MSELSYLEKLLDGVEVEWKTLGTVIKTVTASSKLKSQAYRASGKLPIVDQGIKFIAGYTDEDVTPIEAGKYIIFGDHSEHIKYVDFPFVQGADGLKILSPISANAKYIYHAFLKFYKKELSYKRHWSTAQQTLIPIPCPDNPEKSLAIQSEIVRILDKFTALTAELTAELNMRKKQYNYYRDQLLSFDDEQEKPIYLEKLLDGAEVEWLPLSSLCNLITTGKLNANAMEDNGAYPFFTCNEEPYRINTYAFDLEAILISGNGSQVGHLNYYNGKFNAYQRTYILGGFNENVDIMYLYYYLMHTLKPYIHKNSRKGSVPYITMPMLENFKFPIPCPNNLEKSLAIQSEIVRILDKFDTLTNSITEGLPREIELRQKQYEYYRDLLFSFPKPETVSN